MTLRLKSRLRVIGPGRESVHRSAGADNSGAATSRGGYLSSSYRLGSPRFLSERVWRR